MWRELFLEVLDRLKPKQPSPLELKAMGAAKVLYWPNGSLQSVEWSAPQSEEVLQEETQQESYFEDPMAQKSRHQPEGDPLFWGTRLRVREAD